MFVILWEFEACEGREAEFERAYGPAGDWARFFGAGAGFLGTELLASLDTPRRHITIDRWTSREAFENFRDARAAEYAAIDVRLEALTARETSLGCFLYIPTS